MLKGFPRGLFRRKQIDEGISATPLKRCLTLVDLTALGVGATLGAGVYVVAGQIARNTAGPAAFFSFFIAGVASLLSGICYAEFGARVPRAGSAYLYTYVTMGECWAFFIGWNMILEYVIGAAGVSRAAVSYIDTFTGNALQHTFTKYLPLNVSGLAVYFDPVAAGITILLAAVLAVGARESAMVNNLFTVINVTIITFVSIIGFVNSDFSNWSVPAAEVPPDTATCEKNNHTFGTGGFAPYGFSGVIAGSAQAFFSFVGFDAISTTGEEVINPQRDMPLAIIISLIICCCAYMSMSAVITLVTPYFKLDCYNPIPSAFAAPSFSYLKYVVSVGALCGITTSLLGGMYPLPRVVYSMADDGLLFAWLGRISSRFQTPVYATIASGLLTAFWAALFDLDQLVEMLSIGTLMAYTFVAFSIILLRYDARVTEDFSEEAPRWSAAIYFAVSCHRVDSVNRLVARAAIVIVTTIAFIMFALVFVLSMMTRYGFEPMLLLPVIITSILLTVAIVRLVSLPKNPESATNVGFRVPWVPYIPLLAVFVNLYLIAALQALTWLRFVIWLAIGIIIYVFYGYSHSKASEGSSTSEDTRLLMTNETDDDALTD